MSKSKPKTDAPNPLISSDRVDGTDVYDKNGKKLGKIDCLMIDKKKGVIAYAVLSFGGFLGVGEHQHPLPWKALDYDEDKDGYVIDMTKDKLEDAPSFHPNEIDRLRDEAYAAAIHAYYQFPIY